MATEQKNESSEEWAEIDITPSEDKEADVAFEIEEEPVEEVEAAPEKEEVVAVTEETEEVENSENKIPELEGIRTKGAEKRIRQLVRQRKEREEELSAAQEKIKALEEDAKYSTYSQVSSEEEAVTTTENYLNNQLSMAEQNFKSAYEAGDQEKLLEAQKALTNTQTELRFLEDKKKDVETRKAVLAYEAEEAPKKAPKTPVNVKAKNWASRNEWFGQDKIATATALAIDAELKENGYDPSSDDFFEMIDQRIREELPHKFKEAESAPESEEATPKKPRQTVAGQSRSSASAKKVKLNQEDIRLAKKWGIPIEKYAANKAQMEKADGDYTTIT